MPELSQLQGHFEELAHYANFVGASHLRLDGLIDEEGFEALRAMGAQLQTESDSRSGTPYRVARLFLHRVEIEMRATIEQPHSSRSEAMSKQRKHWWPSGLAQPTARCGQYAPQHLTREAELVTCGRCRKMMPAELLEPKKSKPRYLEIVRHDGSIERGAVLDDSDEGVTLHRGAHQPDLRILWTELKELRELTHPPGPAADKGETR